MERLLIYGYGNPGCQDDGAGILFTERCEQALRNIPGVRTEINYQLNVEDAYLISGFRTVVFADAALSEALPAPGGAAGRAGDAGDIGSGFFFYRIHPAVQIAFSTHAMNPESILGLCEELYEYVPVCYMMHIEGESWEFDRNPTGTVLGNIENALSFFEREGMKLLC
jgi:hydrogenase maturation protease